MTTHDDKVRAAATYIAKRRHEYGDSRDDLFSKEIYKIIAALSTVSDKAVQPVEVTSPSVMFNRWLGDRAAHTVNAQEAFEGGLSALIAQPVARDDVRAAGLNDALQELYRALQSAAPVAQQEGAVATAMGAKGHCKDGDRCVCGGDLPRVREGCGNWVKGGAA